MGRVAAMLAGIVISLFTAPANRIYVVCYQTPDVTYVYDSDEQVYEIQDNGSLLPLKGSVPLERAPAMKYVPVHDTVHASAMSKYNYEMNYYNVCAFLTSMVEDGYELEINLQSPTIMEGYLHGSDNEYHFIATSDGMFRIYSKEAAVKDNVVPYLNED